MGTGRKKKEKNPYKRACTKHRVHVGILSYRGRGAKVKRPVSFSQLLGSSIST